MIRMFVLVICVSWSGMCLAAPLVAEGEARAAEEQRKLFHLPDGFEIQLVASEPEIQKPMNLNFDAKGRLWVSHSLAYPFAVKAGEVAKDGVTVLGDFGEEGKARYVKRFVGDLNIPIGVLPMGDGAIVHEVGRTIRLYDRNGDGVADAREVLFEGFGSVDTHGMNNSFTRWLDGWVYACHGFRNHSKVVRPGGKRVLLEMQSGNTYRFGDKGEKIEQWTWGQVNPFGLCFDELGNLYSADCHTMPVTMLLRGAYYESFGKPHDGVGYGPKMIDHLHGSTGIAGVVKYVAGHYPEDWRGNLIIGNPVTGRVHRDTVVTHGSTYQVKSLKDFISCDDGWFRPVDIKLGPDGAIYVADFYNRIIGHYEVDLKHPGRDRHRGRIWRIVYTGNDGKGKTRKIEDLTKMGMEALVEKLGDVNLTVRVNATHELVDRFGKPAGELLQKKLKSKALNVLQKAHGLWVIERTVGLSEAALEELLNDQSSMVRVHAVKIFEGRAQWFENAQRLVKLRLSDEDDFVKRAAVEVASVKVEADVLPELFDMLSQLKAGDTHLKHMLEIAIRNQMRVDGAIAGLEKTGLNQKQVNEVAVRISKYGHADGGEFILKHLGELKQPRNEMKLMVGYAAKAVDDQKVKDVVRFLRERFADDMDFQVSVLREMAGRIGKNGDKVDSEVAAWAGSVIDYYFKADAEGKGWSNKQVAGRVWSENPWVVQKRKSEDGKEAMYLGSLPRGEQKTGMLVSAVFQAPEQLSFYVAGHDGFPGKPLGGNNKVELIEEGTGRVLAVVAAPRHDTAKKRVMNLKGVAGKKVRLRLVDGDTAGAYAWLAVGRFEPAVVGVPDVSPWEVEAGQVEALRVMVGMNVKGAKERLNEIVVSDGYGDALRTEAMKLISRKAGWVDVEMMLERDLLKDVGLRDPVVKFYLEVGDKRLVKQVVESLKDRPTREQQVAAGILVSKAVGAKVLLEVIENGGWSNSLLRDKVLVGRLRNVLKGDDEKLLSGLIGKLPAVDKTIEQRIKKLAGLYAGKGGNIDKGKQVFETICAACHQVKGKGGLVGPQLDGVWVRGAERVLEDVLDPNRNVDGAFRLQILTLNNGEALAGMVRGEQGDEILLVDVAGKEKRVKRGDVKDKKGLELSLMPAGITAGLSDEAILDLVSYLLSVRPVE